MENNFLKSSLYYLCFILVTVFLPDFSRASASAPTELYNEGNHAYSKGEYSKALDLYAAALDQGATDADLYYNAGNAAYKTGKPGFAVLYYRRALKLAPHDSRIIENLKFVKARIKDKLDEPERGVVTGFLAWCFTLLTLNGFFAAALVLYLVISVMLFFVISGKKGMAKPILLLSSVLLVLVLFLAAKIYDEQLSNAKGVVISEEIKARSEPKKDGETVFTIHEGTSFEINEDHGEWVLITLPTGWSGWVSRNGIEII